MKSWEGGNKQGWKEESGILWNIVFIMLLIRFVLQKCRTRYSHLFIFTVLIIYTMNMRGVVDFQ